MPYSSYNITIVATRKVHHSHIQQPSPIAVYPAHNGRFSVGNAASDIESLMSIEVIEEWKKDPVPVPQSLQDRVSKVTSLQTDYLSKENLPDDAEFQAALTKLQSVLETEWESLNDPATLNELTMEGTYAAFGPDAKRLLASKSKTKAFEPQVRLKYDIFPNKAGHGSGPALETTLLWKGHIAFEGKRKSTGGDHLVRSVQMYTTPDGKRELYHPDKIVRDPECAVIGSAFPVK